MSDHIPDAGKMVCPFCNAEAKPDWAECNTPWFTCGTLVLRNLINRDDQTEQCANTERARIAAELTTLRTAKAALVEEVERLQAWKDAVVQLESTWDAQAIARLLGGTAGESTRAVIAREVPKLVERVKRLEVAGDRMRLLCADGDDCDAWDKAKGHHMKCTRCGSYAINPHLHGRDRTRLDLCDVCWWRNRAETLESHITNLEHAGMHAMLPDANVIDRKRWDEAVSKRP